MKCLTWKKHKIDENILVIRLPYHFFPLFSEDIDIDISEFIMLALPYIQGPAEVMPAWVWVVE